VTRFTLLVTAVLVCAAVVLGAGASAGFAAPADGATAHHRRVLLLAVPALTWQDLRDHHLPNLERLLDRSAVGGLAMRTADGPASSGSGYATIGAGTRAAQAGTTAASAYDAQEPYGSGTAGEEFARRTGHEVTDGVVYLGLQSLDEANSSKLYGAEIGAFGDALAAAGVHRHVIGNADAPVPDPTAPGQVDRALATALMTSTGVVPGGAVGADLRRDDPRAAYGTRLDIDRVDAAFSRSWSDNSVVLVEASDLGRADLYGQYATSEQRTQLRTRALQSTDALVGRLLAQVSFSHDTVLLVSPSHPSGPSSLGVVALHTPGTRTAYLRSPTMRRADFAALVDVAPTVLHVLGIDRPASMEGRPMVVTGDTSTTPARVDHLGGVDVDGRFRDSLVNSMQTTLMVIGCILAAGLVLVALTGRLRRILGAVAVFALALPTMTYLSAPFHFATHGGAGAYRLFLFGGSLVLGAVFLAVGRWTRVSALEAALGVIVALHLVDAVAGGRVEFNTPLGYSATVGIRVAGLGNPTFAQLSTAAVLLAGLLAARGLQRGRRWGVALLAVTFVVLAAPFFGQSFGAALSTAPAFALFAWLVHGRSVRPRHVLALAGIVVLSGLLVGFVDLLRPGSNQTHIGLFFQQVGGQGSGNFFTVVHRKLDENLATWSIRAWVVLTFVAVGTLAWLLLREHLRDRIAWPRDAWRATVWSLGVLLVLGYGFKDSGIAVPAVMLYVILGATAALVGGRGPRPAVPTVAATAEPRSEGDASRSAVGLAAS
jgi:hypothetical protein